MPHAAGPFLARRAAALLIAAAPAAMVRRLATVPASTRAGDPQALPQPVKGKVTDDSLAPSRRAGAIAAARLWGVKRQRAASGLALVVKLVALLARGMLRLLLLRWLLLLRRRLLCRLPQTVAGCSGSSAATAGARPMPIKRHGAAYARDNLGAALKGERTPHARRGGLPVC